MKLDIYNHLDTLELFKKFWGISDIFGGFMTSSMSDFFVILQFFATGSVIKCVENTSRFMGGCTPPLWGATETTFHSSEKWKILTIDAWDNFDNTCKKSFSYLEERSQKSKKFVKGDVHPRYILYPLSYYKFNGFKAEDRIPVLMVVISQRFKKRMKGEMVGTTGQIYDGHQTLCTRQSTRIHERQKRRFWDLYETSRTFENSH